MQDNKNIWHIASANIKSNGGGCDISSQASKDYEFAKLLGQTKGQTFYKDNNTRIKASIFHPMETGLIFGTNEFYINKILIKNKNKLVAKINSTSAISENPRFTFEISDDLQNASIKFFDVDANEFILELK